MTTDRDPLVSIIIPAYDAERTVAGAITGALAQTYPNVEVVVIDDGSHDRTRAICESYADLITFLSIPNGGAAAARNEAIAVARGEFIALCDADDVLLPPHVQAAMDAWRAAGGGRRFVHGDGYLLTADGVEIDRRVCPLPTPTPERQRHAILEGNFVSIFVVAPIEMMRELGGFADTYVEDWDLWVRAVLGGWEAVAQPVRHALYRREESSRSADRAKVYDGEKRMLEDVLEPGRHDLTPEEIAFVHRRLASDSPRALITEAETALRAGDDARARQAFGEAADLWPSHRRLAVKARTMRLPLLPSLWRRRTRPAVPGRDGVAA